MFVEIGGDFAVVLAGRAKNEILFGGHAGIPAKDGTKMRSRGEVGHFGHLFDRQVAVFEQVCRVAQFFL